MTTKFGEFSEPGYLRPGALYQKVVRRGKDKATEDANARASFRAGQATRTGKLNDATFSKFESTNVGLGEGLLPSSRSAADKNGESKPGGAPFKHASPMKLSAPQAGDYYGTLNKFEHFQATNTLTLKKDDIKHEPRNICAAAPKSGGFGTVGSTISQIKGFKGVAGEYEYMADPLRISQRQPEAKDSKMPFKPPQLNSRNGVFAKLEYKSPGPEIKLTKQKVEEKQQKGPAFAPPFAGKTVPKPVPYLANPIHEAKENG